MEETNDTFQGKKVFLVEKTNQRRRCVKKDCEVCGKKYFARTNKIRRGKGKVCSLTCSAKKAHSSRNQKGKNNPNWKGGIREWFYSEVKTRKSCAMCDEEHPACLEFHHKDEENKEMAVSRLVYNGNSKDEIMREIKKCKALCSNCHRKEHNGLYDENGEYIN